MRDKKWLIDSFDEKSALHTCPFIHSSTQAKTCNAKGLKCAMCLCAKAHSRTPIRKKLDCQHIINEKMLKKEHLLLGSYISVDHYMSSVMGCLPHTFGKERIGYSCGNLFVNHASGKMFNFCQFSKNASETINSKPHLKSLARQEGIAIKKYHADNGVFASKEFKGECDILKQEYSLSGVGKHHQNGVAERNIKTVSQWVCANMLHFAHNWPSQANV